MNLKQYEYIWTIDKESYVLVRLKSGEYTIFEPATSMALIIEDDDEYEAVIQKMIDNNCKIVTSDWLNQNKK